MMTLAMRLPRPRVVGATAACGLGPLARRDMERRVLREQQRRGSHQLRHPQQCHQPQQDRLCGRHYGTATSTTLQPTSAMTWAAPGLRARGGTASVRPEQVVGRVGCAGLVAGGGAGTYCARFAAPPSRAYSCLAAAASLSYRRRERRGAPATGTDDGGARARRVLARRLASTATSAGSDGRKSDEREGTTGGLVLFYHPAVRGMALVLRLKLLHACVLSSAILPLVGVWQMGGDVSATDVGIATTCCVGAGGLVLFMTRYLQRFVGKITLVEGGTRLQVSTLDFWGKRAIDEYATADLMPPFLNLPPKRLRERSRKRFLQLEFYSTNRPYYLSFRGSLRPNEDQLLNLFMGKPLNTRVGKKIVAAPTKGGAGGQAKAAKPHDSLLRRVAMRVHGIDSGDAWTSGVPALPRTRVVPASATKPRPSEPQR